MVYLPFFINPVEARALPYRSWRPYTLDSNKNYYFAYGHLVWAVTISAIVNGASETGIPALMTLVCAQFSLLEERFRRLPHTIREMRKNSKPEHEIKKFENDYLIKCIEHHLQIYE